MNIEEIKKSVELYANDDTDEDIVKVYARQEGYKETDLDGLFFCEAGQSEAEFKEFPLVFSMYDSFAEWSTWDGTKFEDSEGFDTAEECYRRRMISLDIEISKIVSDFECEILSLEGQLKEETDTVRAAILREVIKNIVSKIKKIQETK